MSEVEAGPATARWQAELSGWAVPPEIAAGAPEPPWGFPVAQFAARAAAAVGRRTPSVERALAALPAGGSVLDVGCGAGAGTVPLLDRVRQATGVDRDPAMLAAYAEQVGARAGVRVAMLAGDWPGDADAAPVADVVVCHHLAYNVPDLAGLARALSAHARYRVVLELTGRHPMTALRPVWRALHGLDRPTGPSADDAVAVLAEAGIQPERTDWPAEGIGGFAEVDEAVHFVRRRLCLPASRDEEIRRLLADQLVHRGGMYSMGERMHCTLTWPGAAGS
jgi:SAM-dependent methyltransferase